MNAWPVPTGCAGGGGQPIHEGEELGEARGRILLDMDRKMTLRFCFIRINRNGNSGSEIKLIPSHKTGGIFFAPSVK